MKQIYEMKVLPLVCQFDEMHQIYGVLSVRMMMSLSCSAPMLPAFGCKNPNITNRARGSPLCDILQSQ